MNIAGTVREYKTDAKGRRISANGKVIRTARADNARSISTRYTPVEIRFWAKVEKGPQCWLWSGAVRSNGYGRFTMPDGRQVCAHRAAWEFSGRDLEPLLTLDHLCSVRACVNPDHLEQVTRGENSRRALLARTHCKHGHIFDDENTAWSRPRHEGGVWTRRCRACARDRERARNAK